MNVGLHAVFPTLQRNRRIFAVGLLETHGLAKQIVMTDKSLRHFCVFVSVAVKHLRDQMELINYKLLNIMSVFVPLLMQSAILPAASLASSYFYTLSHKRHNFRKKKVTENKMRAHASA